MRRSDHIRACGVYLRVDGKRRSIDGMISFHNVAAMIYQNQIRRANLAEVHPEWVHPEVVELLRIARGDMSRHSFIESEALKKTECGSKHLLAVQALFGGGGEHKRPRNVQYICRCSGHLDLPAP